MKIRQALISVSDKRGIVDFARSLAELGVKILSTGGSAKMLREAGVPVTEVSDYTGFPEIHDGRVKTLHPKVHGGILGIRGNAEHAATMEKHDIPPIDLVIVNLYPFAQTVAKKDCTLADAIESIDTGGPTMVRAAAKNHGSDAGGVGIITDPEDYGMIVEELKANAGALSYPTRFALAKKAFTHTARYDATISNWLTGLDAEDKPTAFPERLLTGERPEPTYLITKPYSPETVAATIGQALLVHREQASLEKPATSGIRVSSSVGF